VEVNGSGKHSFLLQFGNNYDQKKFYIVDCLSAVKMSYRSRNEGGGNSD